MSWDRHFAMLVTEQGWRFAGGAANVYYFEKAFAGSECSARLNMIGWLLGDDAEIAKYGTMEEGNIDWSKIPFGSFIFAVEREPVCGADRYAQ